MVELRNHHMLLNRPKGIYLETSVLYKLPLDIVNAEMQRLQNWAKLLNSGIYVPEVSLKEWMPKRIKSVKDWIEEVDRRCEKLARAFPYIAKMNWKKSKVEIVEETEKMTTDILTREGIVILPTPKLDVLRLVEMSISKKPPFMGGGEKGFRDCVNLLTVLDSAAKCKSSPHLLVAEDRAYHDPGINDIAKEYGVELIVVESIAQAIVELERFIEELLDRLQEERKLVLKQFLAERISTIEEYVKANAEFDTSSLQWMLVVGPLGEVREVTSIRVDDIISVTLGELPEGVTQGRMKISFKVRATVGLKVKPATPLPQRKLRFGEKGSEVADWISWTLTTQHTEPEDRNASLDVKLEGTVYRTLDTKEKNVLRDVFSDLEIERIVI